MSRDAKDSSKPKSDGLRQPQRKDSLSSVLSWAVLQGKITASKPPTSSSSSTPSPAPSPATQHHPGNGTRPRRHSHSTSIDSKTKARRGSTAFRRFSFSFSTTNQDGASTKTRHSKTSSMTPDPKASPGTSKAGKTSSEKVNKAAPDNQDGKHNPTPPRPQSAGDKPRSPLSPMPMPKSILRISSPDGYRRPRQFVSPEAAGGEPASPGLPPSPATPTFETVLSAPDSPPPPTESPPASPIPRPMSPGATVRFAKATVHRVEVGPGRRFMPVKRKSKSTLTYISPLDPGAQKSAPKTMLQSPTKLRRHQENQAAMGRYWLRTEEEEAQWRAEAERRAVEEAERYRNEPASPAPRPPVGVVAKVDGAVSKSGGEIDKLPLLDAGPVGLDMVEEEAAMETEDEDSEDEAGAKCNVEEDDTASVTSKSSRKSVNLRLSASKTMLRAAGAAASTPTGTKLTEIKSFSERLAEKQAEEERRSRPASPMTIPTNPGAESSKSARSSSSSLSKEKPAAGAVSARSSSASTDSNSSSSSGGSSSGTADKLSKTLSREKEKEKDKAKDRPRTLSLSSSRSYMNLRSASGRSRELRSANHTSNSTSHGNSNNSSNINTNTNTNSHSHSHSHSHSSSGGSSGSSTNHLHLSGRRGRRYFDDHKQGITA
ncbi:uncharacterized protein B0H64DRAFT_110027 [Chaetomium fimeti]|uniref:Uncharacterized protein n=1 Tax=Chaetomium fimeti TaxID=1854472 RepID=A0AAE0HHZ2_9PEZI|nr:hypothetical protein B0H64DRAFT_110027 [Chaetomium fimeti]